MNHVDEFDAHYAFEQLRRSRHFFRKMIKYFYLENILRDVQGKTIDFGCGAGQLLARLPAGSLGLEVNPHLVHALRKAGLRAQQYDVEDHFSFTSLPSNHYRTFVMVHVLEHFDAADALLHTILQSCHRIGIERAIIVVPGLKGFQSDKTHKTFINRSYLAEHGLLECAGYKLKAVTYFPFNKEFIGNHFVFHEMKLIYERL